MKFKSYKPILFAIGLFIASNGAPLLADLSKSAVISNTATTSSAATATDSSTVAGVKSAKWGSNVEISYSGNSFIFVSNGIPNHAALLNMPCQNLKPCLEPSSTKATPTL
jgi:hypothetical protein